MMLSQQMEKNWDRALCRRIHWQSHNKLWTIDGRVLIYNDFLPFFNDHLKILDLFYDDGTAFYHYHFHCIYTHQGMSVLTAMIIVSVSLLW